MMRWWRDLWRGYSDADVKTAHEKVNALPVRPERRPSWITLRMTRREWRAFFGEDMTIQDGLDWSPGFHLPPVLCEIVDGPTRTAMPLEDIVQFLGVKP